MTRISKPPEERKKELLLTALKLFNKKGYENTSISEIVSSLNVAQGLFYYYFKSKENLLEELAKYTMQYFAEYLNNTPYYDEDTNALGKLKIFYQSIINSHISSEMDIYCGMEKNATFLSKLQQAENEFYIKELTTIIQMGNEEGVFHCKYPVEISKILVIGITSIMYEDFFENYSPETSDFPREIFCIMTECRELVVYAASRLLEIDEEKLENMFNEMINDASKEQDGNHGSDNNGTINQSESNL